MSILCLLKKALRASFMGTVFWNSAVLSLEGMVRRAATFHVNIRNDLESSIDGGICNDSFRSGGEIGTFRSDMSGLQQPLFWNLLCGAVSCGGPGRSRILVIPLLTRLSSAHRSYHDSPVVARCLHLQKAENIPVMKTKDATMLPKSGKVPIG